MGAKVFAVRMALLLAGFVLTGCSLEPRLLIVNDVGRAIGVHLDGRADDAGWQDEVIILKPGERHTFVAGVVIKAGRVALRVGGCELAYALPYGTGPNDDRRRTIFGGEVRLAAGGTPVLIPLATRDVGGGRRATEALDDEPVYPATTPC